MRVYNHHGIMTWKVYTILLVRVFKLDSAWNPRDLRTEITHIKYCCMSTFGRLMGEWVSKILELWITNIWILHANHSVLESGNYLTLMVLIKRESGCWNILQFCLTRVVGLKAPKFSKPIFLFYVFSKT